MRRRVADHAASLRTSADVRFDRSEPSADAYWLHRAYQDAPHDETLQKSDVLHQAIEDSGCLVLEVPESKIMPEMVPGCNRYTEKQHSEFSTPSRMGERGFCRIRRMASY